MGKTTRQRSGRTANATDQTHRQNTTTASQIESLSRLYGTPATLVDHAKQLVIDMKSSLPVDGLQVGVLHQLGGKRLHGVLCTSIIVFADFHAEYTDYDTGVHVTVNSAGSRNASILRPSR